MQRTVLGILLCLLVLHGVASGQTSSATSRAGRFKAAKVKEGADGAAKARVATEATMLPNDAWKVGDVGTLWDQRCTVLQVIDDKNCLAAIRKYQRDYSAPARGSVAPLTLIAEKVVWLEVPTKGFVDDEDRHLAVVFEVVGTKRYTITEGSRTVHHLRPKRQRDAPAESPMARPRSVWLNTSYDTTLRHVKDAEWEEIDNKTGHVKWKLTEVGRTDDAIEMRNEARDQLYRILDKRLELKDGGTWKWLSNGQWEHTRRP